MKKRYSLFIGILLFSIVIAFSRNNKNIQETGYVPDDSTALKIAEAILLPIYGPEILKQKPFKVELIGDSLWVVEGTKSEISKGGTAYISFLKSNCKVIRVTHGK